jgi:hypothetical protein
MNYIVAHNYDPAFDEHWYFVATKVSDTEWELLAIFPTKTEAEAFIAKVSGTKS